MVAVLPLSPPFNPRDQTIHDGAACHSTQQQALLHTMQANREQCVSGLRQIHTCPHMHYNTQTDTHMQ